MPDTHFFLGTNGPGGFYSIYDELTEDPRFMLYILKGGPGCGKSSFMKTIGAAAAARGMSAEYIRCSGDPDSVDCVLLPEAGAAFMDGTAPHAADPRAPGVSGMYVDLGRFYDPAGLRGSADAICALGGEIKKRYARAYDLMKSAYFAAEGARSALMAEDTAAAVRRRAQGIAGREFKRARPGQRRGALYRRFLSAHTCRGEYFCEDTPRALCGRLYLLDNECGLADVMLRELADAARAAGRDVILCPDPMRPERAEHLLVPELGLGFVSGGRGRSFGEIYRHVRLDAMASGGSSAPLRKRARAAKRHAGAMMDEAYACLAEAKSLHDTLERLYNPHVDFAGVYDEAARYAAAVLGE